MSSYTVGATAREGGNEAALARTPGGNEAALATMALARTLGPGIASPGTAAGAIAMTLARTLGLIVGGGKAAPALAM